MSKKKKVFLKNSPAVKFSEKILDCAPHELLQNSIKQESVTFSYLGSDANRHICECNIHNHIHNHNFKHNFSKLPVARAFVKHNLPKEVVDKMALDTVRIEAGDFVCSFCNGARNTELLYSVKSKNGGRLYVLVYFEAQAKHEKEIASFILECHIAIGRAHFNKGYEKLPLIYIIVLYNGKEE